MTTAQNRTLDQYHEMMHINAVSHLIRAGRDVGLFQALYPGQRTLEQLCESLSLKQEPTLLLLDGLVAIGIIEQYGEDYALSQAARLLCQYDEDFGDARWMRVVDRVSGRDEASVQEPQTYYDHVAATQWIHTPAAMQAAEILNIGGEGECPGPQILDLGAGSAVWSCAMAYRDKDSSVTAVDHEPALKAAKATAASIELGERYHEIEGDPLTVPLEANAYDIVLLAQRLFSLDGQQSDALLARAVGAAKPGGRVVVIDHFRGPTRPNLAESLEALKLELETSGGRMRSLDEARQQMARQHLVDVQFTFLAASRVNLGMAVGVKPDPEAAQDPQADSQADASESKPTIDPPDPD